MNNINITEFKKQPPCIKIKMCETIYERGRCSHTCGGYGPAYNNRFFIQQDLWCSGWKQLDEFKIFLILKLRKAQNKIPSGEKEINIE
jgi:hypothetical protein